MPPPGPETIPVQNPDVAFRVIDGAAVLVGSGEPLLYWLNPVATRIWELADGQRDLSAIARTLCEEFEVDLETSLRDAGEMVDAFTAKQLFSTPG